MKAVIGGLILLLSMSPFAYAQSPVKEKAYEACLKECEKKTKACNNSGTDNTAPSLECSTDSATCIKNNCPNPLPTSFTH